MFVQLCISLVLCLVLSSYASAALPSAARKIINQLPGRKVSLDVVLGLGISSSDQYKLISSDLFTKDDARLLVDAALDSKITVGAGFLEDRLKETGNVGIQGEREIIKGKNARVGYDKLFSTGTSLSAGVSMNDNFAIIGKSDLGTPAQSIDQTEVRYSFAIRQQLWKNFLGRSIREGLKAGTYQSESIELAVQDATDEFAVSLIDFYYNAWLAQARVFADSARLARQKRLLEITKIQQRRGNAVESNVLQIRAALRFTEQVAQDSEKVLGDLWRNLVTTLKLPKVLLTVDPKLVPMIVDSKFNEAQALCKTKKDADVAVKMSPKLRQAEALKEASDLEFKRQNRDGNPQLVLELKYVKNSVSGTSEVGPKTSGQVGSREEVNVNPFIDGFNGPHDQIRAGFLFEVPWGNIEGERKVSTAFKNKYRADTRLSQLKAELAVTWMNACKALERSSRKVDAMIRIYKDQLRRSKLESRRFKLGRVSALEVITAGNDVSDAEMSVAAARRDLRVNAWQVIRLNGGIKAHLDKVEKKHIQVKW